LRNWLLNPQIQRNLFGQQETSQQNPPENLRH